jgi:PAS domain S-box-containing protein
MNSSMKEEESHPEKTRREQGQIRDVQRASLWELEERNKELAFQNSLTDILEDFDADPHTVCRKTADMLPSAFQFPEFVCAQISLDGMRTYCTGAAVCRGELSITAPIAGGSVSGELKVFSGYPPDFAQRHPDRAVFLEEEKNLLGVTAHRLANYLDRQQIRKSLTESEQRFKTLVHSVNDVIYEISSDGTIAYVSPSITRMLGYTPEEVTGKNFFSYMYPDDVPALTQALSSLGKSDYSYLEYRYVTKTGEIRWVRSSTNPVVENGRVVGGRGSLTDIHERKTAELKLREHEFQLRVLFDKMSQGAVLQDGEGRIVQLNASAEQILQVEQQELIGNAGFLKDSWRAVDEKGHSIPHSEAPPFKALRTGTSIANQTMGIVREGNRVDTWILISSEPVFREGADDAPFQVFTTFTDITRMKEVEEKLLSSEARFRTLVSSQTSYVVQTDLEGRYTYVNDTFIREYGWLVPEGLIGSNSLKTISPSCHTAAYETVQKCLAHPGEIFKVELEKPAPDGGRRMTLWEFVSLSDETGMPAGIQCMGIDFTDRKLAEDNLRKFRTISDQANYGNAIATLDGVLVYVNPCFAQMHGYTVEEITGKPLSMLHSADQMPHVQKTLDILQRDGNFSAAEVWRVKKDGTLFPSLMNATIITDEKRAPQLMSATVIDITELKEKEQALLESEELLNDAETIALMGSWYFSIETGSVRWSRNYYRLMDMTPDREPLSLTEVKKIVHPDDRYLFEAALKRISQTHQGEKFRYRLMDLKSGDTLKWLETVIVPVLKDGTLKAVKGVTLDVTESVLRESEIRKLNLAIEQSPAALVVTDLEGVITYVSPAFSHITGYRAEEAVGRPTSILKSGRTSQAVYEELWKTITSGKVWKGEWQNRKKDGTYYYEHASISPVTDDSGKIISYLAVKQDITERKLAEEEQAVQKRRTEKQKTALEHMVLDPSIADGILPQALERIAEIVSEAVSVDRVSIWKMAEDGSGIESLVEYYAQDKSMRSGSVIARSAAASYLSSLEEHRRLVITDAQNDPLSADLLEGYLLPNRVTSILDAGIVLEGKLAGVLCLDHCGSPRQWFADEEFFAGAAASVIGQILSAVERRYAEELRKSSDDRYRDIVEHIHEGIWLLDADNRTTFVNAHMAAMLGWTADEMTAADFYSFIDPQQREEARSVFSAAETARGSVSEEYELTLITKQGSPIPVEIRSEPVLAAPGQFSGTRKMVSDITDRKRVQNERIARKAAEQANVSKSVFLSNMSHEIRTPLNAIIGFAQILQRSETLAPDELDQINIILRSGEHLLMLINDILDISKIEAGRMTISENDFSLHDMLDDTQTMFQTLAREKGLQLLLEVEEHTPEHIHSDESKLRQVLINLLGNALKFTQEGGVAVRVRADRGNQGSLLIAEIEDTGPGIPEEDLPRVFDSFHQAHAGRAAGGTGLGLAICRNMIELMGGSISVESHVGRGSKFRFTVPIQSAETARMPKETAATGMLGRLKEPGTVRVLVVDDRKNNRLLLRALLQPAGFLVKEAADGSEGCALAQVWQPHIILMDLRMPVMDGYEAVRLIRESESGNGIPIIAVTASAFDEDEVMVKEAGFNGYIRKPFRMYEILEIIREHLQLQYLYDDDSSAMGEEQPEAVLVGQISHLPPALCARLRQAVEEGDMAVFRKLLYDAADADSPEVKTLLALALAYDYDRLAQLLESCGGNNA